MKIVKKADGRERAAERREAAPLKKWIRRGDSKRVVELRGTSGLSELRALSKQIDTAGGYLVPESFEDSVEVALFDASPMRRLASIERRETGSRVPFPTTNDTSNEGSLLQENQLFPSTDIAFGQVNLDPKKFGSDRLILPWELIEDGMSSQLVLQTWLGRLLGQRVARAQNRRFTVGTGASQPLGVVPAAYPVSAGSSTAIADIDLIALIQAVDPAYQESESCVFMAHPTIIHTLRGLKDGAGRPLYLDAPDRYLRVRGFPVIPNITMTTSIAPGQRTMLFGDFSKYQILDVRDFEVETYTEAPNLAENDAVAIQGVLRSDGTLLDAGTHPVVALQH